jgi:adenylate kinase family enzyme
MRRVLVLGSSGSGKSTFTSRLGRALGVEAIHLDSHFWRPDWTATPKADWHRTVSELSERDAWVMDGNYPDLLEMRIQRADTVVFLDYPRLVCLWRCVRRYLRHRGSNRPELAAGCDEKIDWEFLKWIWFYPQNVTPFILSTLKSHADRVRVFRLQGDRAVKRFLADLDDF